MISDQYTDTNDDEQPEGIKKASEFNDYISDIVQTDEVEDEAAEE